MIPSSSCCPDALAVASDTSSRALPMRYHPIAYRACCSCVRPAVRVCVRVRACARVYILATGSMEICVACVGCWMKHAGFMEIRKIEAAREVANSIANANNKVYLSADSLLFNTLGGSVAAVAQK